MPLISIDNSGQTEPLIPVESEPQELTRIEILLHLISKTEKEGFMEDKILGFEPL